MPLELTTLRLGARYLMRRMQNRPQVWDLNIVATNRCNQGCAMCNAVVLDQSQAAKFTLASFDAYCDKLSDQQIPICTISGGEPTLVPEMPGILESAARRFPVRVMLISNFYAQGPLFQSTMRTALSLGLHIVCSFDGFDDVADELRGASGVSERVVRNMKWLTALRSQMSSRATLELHTVIADRNLSQVERILTLSSMLGWRHTIAPKNGAPQSQRHSPNGLTNGPELRLALRQVKAAANVRQLTSYVDGVPAFADGRHTKHCPYLTSGLERLKIFLEPNGDVSLCDRDPIGSLRTETIDQIFEGKRYGLYLERARKCQGCWLSCFTEPVLATKPTSIQEALCRF